jgi:hypothetical protein
MAHSLFDKGGGGRTLTDPAGSPGLILVKPNLVVDILLVAFFYFQLLFTSFSP